MDFTLSGGSLGERQREINEYVKKAVSQNIDFNELKDTHEPSDAFKIAKIDIASKYKRVDYMLEILKSGDPLFISRVLKCVGLYTEEFSNIVNTEYLHHNVFPFMSIKMQKKMLSTISIHLRDESRAAEFYTYCLNNKLDNLAYKYLLFTSESFKLELIKGDPTFRNTVMDRPNDYLKHLIRKSFILAEELLKTKTRSGMLHALRFLYSVNNITFLDLVEKQYKIGKMKDEYSTYYINSFQFGLRHSKDIMKSHKDRVFKNTHLYVNIIDKHTLCKYSSVEDAKIYMTTLIPERIDEFWRTYYDNYRHIIELIPPSERFEHFKNIFMNKYLEAANKASGQFYNKYNMLMTSEQREAWALRQLESKSNLEDEDLDFYKFGNFDKGFEEIKKRIIITPLNTKRLNYLNILVESAKNQTQIEKLLAYFYERHVNEQKLIKMQFIDKVKNHHNIIEFDESCWTPLNKIFHSLEVYNTKSRYRSKRRHRGNNSGYKSIALVYYIIKGKDVPRPLKHHIESYHNKMKQILTPLINKLTDEQKETVNLYLLDYCIEKLHTFENETYDDDVKNEVRKYLKSIIDLLDSTLKPKWQQPDIFSKFVSLDWDYFKSYPGYLSLFSSSEQNSKPKRLTQTYLLQKLKRPEGSICDDLPLLIKEIDRKHGIVKLNVFLKKINVYFQDGDMGLAHSYLRYFIESLSQEGKEDEGVNQKIIRAVVFCIFQLADEDFKVQFMLEHAPTESKIAHDTIGEKLLYIRQAICAYACVSRPPIPMDVMLKYIKGDYVIYCLPIFYSYRVHLPTPLSTKFIESLLDKGLSVQKHGIRLAFQYFPLERIVTIATSAWNKTKNVSLRLILYKAVFNKILSVETIDAQDKLYDVLKSFTSDLHEDDDAQVFDLLTSDNLPMKYLDDYVELAWETVIKLPKNLTNLERIKNVVNCMQQQLQRKQNALPPGPVLRQYPVSGFNQYRAKPRFSRNPMWPGGR